MTFSLPYPVMLLTVINPDRIKTSNKQPPHKPALFFIPASMCRIFIIGLLSPKIFVPASLIKMQQFPPGTPYKQNANGLSYCKVLNIPTSYYDVNPVNNYSYLRHEFEQAKKKEKTIIVAYNSLYKQPSWLPWYMSAYANNAQPFWIKNVWGNKIGNYSFIKKALGYE